MSSRSRAWSRPSPGLKACGSIPLISRRTPGSSMARGSSVRCKPSSKRSWPGIIGAGDALPRCRCRPAMRLNNLVTFVPRQASLLPEGPRDLVVERLDEVGQHTAIGGLDEHLDRHAGHQFDVAE